jgi:hypothetical protein
VIGPCPARCADRLILVRCGGWRPNGPGS